MSTTLVSIGVPVFNGADYLESAIDALLAQTHQNLEILIADNASNDGSLEIAQRYARVDSRVRVLQAEENLGAAWNYNRLVDAASGPYFKWAAHDDLCLPDYVAKCADALDANASAVLAYPKTSIIDGAGDMVRHYEDRLNINDANPIRRVTALLWHVGLCNAVFGVVRTDELRSTGLIQSFDSSDIALLAELALRGKIVEVDDRLFLRRRHQGASRSANTSSDAVAAWFAPDAKSGRSLRLIKAYLAAAARWDVGPALKIAAVIAFAIVGPVTEVRWHRRRRRRSAS